MSHFFCEKENLTVKERRNPENKIEETSASEEEG